MGRFVGTALAHFCQADFILLVYAAISVVLSAYTSFIYGRSAVFVLIVLYFFESLMFPTIFVMGTANLGRHTRRGAGILIMGVSGGAAFPPIQGALADAYSTRISFLVPMVGFIFVLVYATFHWIKHGFKVRHARPTADIHVIPTPGQKKSSVIISQETVDNVVETKRKLSHISDTKDILNYAMQSKSAPIASEKHTTDSKNQTGTTVENT